jgi:pimeloyl-ACP methyl ester carboxylesterase
MLLRIHRYGFWEKGIPNAHRRIVNGLEILDWSKAARHISAPILIMWGEKDELMLERDQVTLREALPNAQFICYPGLGHSMYWQEPERCAKDLQKFLQ